MYRMFASYGKSRRWSGFSFEFFKADGLLKLGLYSRHARSEIKWARIYKEKKISVTEENIKNFRSKIFTSKKKISIY